MPQFMGTGCNLQPGSTTRYSAWVSCVSVSRRAVSSFVHHHLACALCAHRTGTRHWRTHFHTRARRACFNLSPTPHTLYLRCRYCTSIYAIFEAVAAGQHAVRSSQHVQRGIKDSSNGPHRRPLVEPHVLRRYCLHVAYKHLSQAFWFNNGGIGVAACTATSIHFAACGAV